MVVWFRDGSMWRLRNFQNSLISKQVNDKMGQQHQALDAVKRLMDWEDDEAEREFAWLRFMSARKFDAYRDFQAGARFILSLAIWLSQFNTNDERQIAYDLLRTKLLFLSAAEMNRLVALFYPRVVLPDLMSRAAKLHDIQDYMVWAHDQAPATLRMMRRKILFMGLSDGARIDVLRQLNAHQLNNEQIVLQPFLDFEKWKDMDRELKRDSLLVDDPEKKFDTLYVIDDFSGSGTTFIRQSGDEWKGKLPKLWRSMEEARSKLRDDFPIVTSPAVHVHHYLITRLAKDRIADEEKEIRKYSPDEQSWFSEIHFTEGMELPDSFRLDGDHPFVEIANRYYDPVLESRHAGESGNSDMRLGYGQCALPLILEHNTPNNALSLLWADTEGKAGSHPMRPLFRRRQRHS